MLKETYEFVWNGKKVVVEYTPANESPARQIDTGTVTVKMDGTLIGDFPGQKTSFIPMPAVLFNLPPAK